MSAPIEEHPVPNPPIARRPRRRRRGPFATLLMAGVVAAVLLAGCGGAGTETAAAVASLEDTTTTEPAPADGDVEPDEAALEFSQCMRDEGLDFPDVGVDANGNPDIRDAFVTAGVSPQAPEFRDAMDSCGTILADAGFGGGGRQGLADNTELQDALVEYSDCLRDEGLDVGDVQLGGGAGAGAGAGGDGAAPEPGQGRGQGGFGDPSERIAAFLDIDPSDPEVAAALETCDPILDTALSEFGRGNG